MRKFASSIMAVCLVLLMAVPAFAGTTELVSVSSTGEQGDRMSRTPSISADGRFVAFESWSTNLVASDINGQTDIFVHDRNTGAMEIVSISNTGEHGNGQSREPSISANGRFVAFESRATNLVPSDINGQTDIFIHDRITDAMEIVSISNTGEHGNGQSREPSISADGRFVAFGSNSSNLSPGISGTQIYVHDRELGTTIAVSVNEAGNQGNGSSRRPSISGDGRLIAFESRSNNLVQNDTNKKSDVFVFDMADGSLRGVSVDSKGKPANGASNSININLNGNIVTFSSDATNLVTPGMSSDQWQIYTHDLDIGETKLITISADGTEGNEMSYYSGISGDGRYVAFATYATNLVPGTLENQDNLIIADRQTGEFELVTIYTDIKNYGYSPSLSANGKYVVFASRSSNLVPGDKNGQGDVFVYTRK